MSDNWTRLKYRWLDRVMHETRLSPRARLVSYEIFIHLNKERGEAWPSQNTIMRKMGLKDVSQVKRAIRSLKDLGYIEIYNNPKTRANSYVPRFDILPGGPREVKISPSQIVKTSSSKGGNVIAAADRLIDCIREFDAPAPGENTRLGNNAPRPSLGAETPHRGSIAPIGGGNSATTWGQERPVGGGNSATQSYINKYIKETEALPEAGTLTPVEGAWHAVLNVTTHRYGIGMRNSWFGQLALGEHTDTSVTLVAPSRFLKARIERDYLPALAEAWRSEMPSIVDVRIVLAETQVGRC